MKNKELSQENLCFICRLGLERCRQNLSHLQALMYVTGLGEGENALSGAIAAVIANIDMDLKASHDALDAFAA